MSKVLGQCFAWARLRQNDMRHGRYQGNAALESTARKDPAPTGQ
jgi:hypothetical protein